MRGILAAAWLALVALASGVAGQETGEDALQVGVEIRLEGSALPVLHVRIPEGWSVYAADPGEAGLPLTLRWEPAAAAGAPVSLPAEGDFPVPRVAVQGGARVRVYRDRLRVPLAPPPEGAGPWVLAVRWAACRGDLCVPGSARLAWPRPGRLYPARPTR